MWPGIRIDSTKTFALFTEIPRCPYKMIDCETENIELNIADKREPPPSATWRLYEVDTTRFLPYSAMYILAALNTTSTVGEHIFSTNFLYFVSKAACHTPLRRHTRQWRDLHTRL